MMVSFPVVFTVMSSVCEQFLFFFYFRFHDKCFFLLVFSTQEYTFLVVISEADLVRSHLIVSAGLHLEVFRESISVVLHLYEKERIEDPFSQEKGKVTLNVVLNVVLKLYWNCTERAILCFIPIRGFYRFRECKHTMTRLGSFILFLLRQRICTWRDTTAFLQICFI